MRIRIRISIRVRTAYQDQDIIRTRTSDWNQDGNKDQDWELVQDPALRLESGSEPMNMIRNRTSDEDKHQYQDQYLRSVSAPHIRIRIRTFFMTSDHNRDHDHDLDLERIYASRSGSALGSGLGPWIGIRTSDQSFILAIFGTEFLNQICFIGFLSILFKNMSKLIKIKRPN